MYIIEKNVYEALFVDADGSTLLNFTELLGKNDTYSCYNKWKTECPWKLSEILCYDKRFLNSQKNKKNIEIRNDESSVQNFQRVVDHTTVTTGFESKFEAETFFRDHRLISAYLNP